MSSEAISLRSRTALIWYGAGCIQTAPRVIRSAAQFILVRMGCSLGGQGSSSRGAVWICAALNETRALADFRPDEADYRRAERRVSAEKTGGADDGAESIRGLSKGTSAARDSS